MRKSRFSEGQIIAILREQEAGIAVTELCRKHAISSPTFYKWKARFGGLDASGAPAGYALRYARAPRYAAGRLQTSALRGSLFGADKGSRLDAV